jgi:hypothetical protein
METIGLAISPASPASAAPSPKTREYVLMAGVLAFRPAGLFPARTG